MLVADAVVVDDVAEDADALVAASDACFGAVFWAFGPHVCFQVLPSRPPSQLHPLTLITSRGVN